MNRSALSIATTTATLRGVLAKGLNGVPVTARALDIARQNTAGDQVNLFLYQALPDAAWRNQDMPGRILPGETGQPPLALSLYYLITAYCTDEDDVKSHLLLGKAMSVLHDYPLLDGDAIKNATNALPELKDLTNLHEQTERVRITLQPLTFEEISKLWTTFQTHYRTSAAYQVSVVLIESMRAMQAPLPVLKRGDEDRGPEVTGRALPQIDEIRVPFSGSFDLISDVRLTKTLPRAQLNDEIAILGRNFSSDVRVRFKHPLAPESFEQSPTELSEDILRIKLPDAVAANDKWPAGMYTVSVITSGPDGRDVPSNELMLPLAPTIEISPAASPAGNLTVTVKTIPALWKQQSVSLVKGDQQIPHESLTVTTDEVTFDLKAVAVGEYVLRLRVDGVDSVPVDRTSETPKFADEVTLKVTP